MELNTTMPNLVDKNTQVSHMQRRQILSLLLLKKSIMEYEKNSFDSPQTHRATLNGKSVTSANNQYKNKLEKPKDKVDCNVKVPQRTKCQSQRILKKMKTVENNRRQLLRGQSQNIKVNQLKSFQQEERSKLNRFVPNQAKLKGSGRVFRQAQTLSYLGQNYGLVSNEKVQDRMKILIQKNRNKIRSERTKIAAPDNQYQDIQNILNRMQSKTQQIKLQTSVNTQSELKQELKHDLVKFQQDKSKNKRRSIIQAKLGLKSKLQFQRECQNHKILKDRYQILQRIGRGLSGEVFKGKDILSQRFVAIKILKDDSVNKQHEFYKKIQHQNIVSYYNGFIEKDKRYLILQYFPHTLAKMVRNNKFQQNQIRGIFKHIANGLMFLHGIAIAHRDIKLDNIVISQDLSVVKFIDFGLCLDINESENQRSMDFCGTVHYMPPQILSKKQYDPRKADIWSLGILLYKLAFQRYPYRGKDERQLLEKINHTKLIFPQSCNVELKNILNGMLVRAPGNRFSILDVVQHKWFQ